MCNTRGRTAEIAARPFLRLKPKEEFPLQQMSGTLTNLVIYLALVVLGAFIGSRPGVRSRPMPWLGRFQTAALLLLIFTLGAELGANEEIVSSLGSIGLNAFAITITSMIGSMLAVHALRKYILKMDAFGRTAQEAQAEEAQASHEKAHVESGSWPPLSWACWADTLCSPARSPPTAGRSSTSVSTCFCCWWGWTWGGRAPCSRT